MLEEDRVRRAVGIQKRAYKLLLWMGKAIERGFIQFGSVHRYTTAGEAGIAWAREHFENLPEDARPPSRSEEDLRSFGNMLASFLESSFELVEEPKPKASEAICACTVCAFIFRGSHVATRKVSLADKKRANRLMRDLLRESAMEAGEDLSERDADERIGRGDLDEELALVAYGRELLRRLEGLSEGTAVLALWRKFAWKKTGSPKKGFELTAEMILEAEKKVRTVLRPS